jgi:hypothetical protein
VTFNTDKEGMCKVSNEYFQLHCSCHCIDTHLLPVIANDQLCQLAINDTVIVSKTCYSVSTLEPTHSNKYTIVYLHT